MKMLNDKRAMLVLVRHGQSEWNFANRFIGWYDSPLTEEGEWEAEEAGQLLRDHNIEVDEVHTSMLDRVMSTAKLALDVVREAGLSVPPDTEVRSSWRLNERNYGALTGRNKKDCTKEYGKDQVKLWRRSWDVPPPPYEDGCELHETETEAFKAKVEMLAKEGKYDPEADPPPHEVPRGESLKDTQERVAPYWENVLLPSLQAGKKVVVFGHENNLRALLKILDDIGEDDILTVDVPRAMPMVYIFEREELITAANKPPRLRPLRLTPEDAPEGSELLSARYLADAELIGALHKRDIMNVYDTSVEENLEEVCIIDENTGDMCHTIGEYVSDIDTIGRGHSTEGLPLIGEPIFVKRPDQKKEPKSGPSNEAFLMPSKAAPGSTSGQRSHATSSVGADKDITGSFSGLAPLAAFLLAGVFSRVRPQQRKGRALRRLSEIAMRAGKEVAAVNEESLLDTLNRLEYPDRDDEPLSVGEEEICELAGYDLDESLVRQICRPFTFAEQQEAYDACGFNKARSSSKPQAIWLMGPSAVGKSTLAPKVAAWTGIEENDYVLVDGEPFRDAHSGYQSALQEGNQLGCIWWGAYVGIRENVNIEKQDMLSAASEASKHLVIPSTCLRRSQCVDVAEMLLEKGYTVHIVAIHGDRAEINKRGSKRAALKGKRFDPREFGQALVQIRPMLELCNGSWMLFWNTGENPHVPTHKGKGPLSKEEIKDICTEFLTPHKEDESVAAALAEL